MICRWLKVVYIISNQKTLMSLLDNRPFPHAIQFGKWFGAYNQSEPDRNRTIISLYFCPPWPRLGGIKDLTIRTTAIATSGVRVEAGDTHRRCRQNLDYDRITREREDAIDMTTENTLSSQQKFNMPKYRDTIPLAHASHLINVVLLWFKQAKKSRFTLHKLQSFRSQQDDGWWM